MFHEDLASTLKYVGVSWFLFHVLQLLPIRFTREKLMLHKHIYETRLKIKPLLIYVIRSACLLISRVDIYVLPIIFTIE